MRVTLIHNPKAGEESQPSGEELQELVEKEGHEVRYQSSKDKEWTKVLKKKTDLVAVAGGDGMVGKVARRMVGGDVPIAILPLGTANNISKTLGFAEHPLEELVAAWESAERVKVDAGVATGPWGRRYFVEGIGIGVFADTMARMDDNGKAREIESVDERIAYALRVLRRELNKAAPKSLRCALDGKDVSGEYLVFEAMLTQYIGPNLFFAPAVSPGDGQFEAVFVTEDMRPDLDAYLASWRYGEPWPPELVTRRGRELQVDWDGYCLHIDDKSWPVKDKVKDKDKDEADKPALIEVHVERAALEFIVPA